MVVHTGLRAAAACYSADTLSIPIETPNEVRGECSRTTVITCHHPAPECHVWRLVDRQATMIGAAFETMEAVEARGEGTVLRYPGCRVAVDRPAPIDVQCQTDPWWGVPVCHVFEGAVKRSDPALPRTFKVSTPAHTTHPRWHVDLEGTKRAGPCCVLVCTQETFTKGRSIFSRSTENLTCLSIIVSRTTAFTGEMPAILGDRTARRFLQTRSATRRRRRRRSSACWCR